MSPASHTGPDVRSELVLIDIGPLLGGAHDGEAAKAVGRQIDRACRRLGIFRIVGHRIEPVLLTDMDTAAREFFARSQAKRQVAMRLAGSAWRGWFPVRGSVMGGIALGLELTPDWFERQLTADPTVLFRIFHYPALDDNASAPEWGVGEHTDYGLLTLLAQHSSGGLQVKTPAGTWVMSPPNRASSCAISATCSTSWPRAGTDRRRTGCAMSAGRAGCRSRCSTTPRGRPWSLPYHWMTHRPPMTPTGVGTVPARAPGPGATASTCRRRSPRCSPICSPVVSGAGC